MLGSVKRLADRLSPFGVAHAHCDIPCGIYDPNDAIQAAQTCIRMTELILESEDVSILGARNNLIRYVAAKEEHATKAKDDILIIWTDYFKPEHLEKYPNLHELVWNACKLGSQVKQNIDMEAAQAFKAALEEIGNIFWETKQ
ncbi:MAG: superoxide dismutase, Ni [Chloroflexi bacterium]|nr:superoxide dismutase, Ni [Chloroflexota bacterium]